MNDTIKDIVADLRQEASDCPDIGRSGIYDRYADRLEAAWKREKAEIEAAALEAGGVVEAARQKPVGNAAAMREAALPWIAFAEWLLENAGKGALGAAIRDSGPIIRQRLDELRAALAAPPRNCDLGTAEEQFARYNAFCAKMMKQNNHCCGPCPCYKFVNGEAQPCTLLWSQMPCDEEGGEK